MPTLTPRRATPVRALSTAVPLVDPVELAELRHELKAIAQEVRRVKHDLAWQRMIDDAIRVCRLLHKVEMAEAVKDWRDQPRVPAGNSDGGQWTDGGGGGSGLGLPGVTPSDGSDYSVVDTLTGARIDTTERDGRRITERFGEDGVLTSRSVENEDGSKLESEFRTPDDPGQWNERHTFRTADGRTYWVTNTGDVQKITTGDDGDVLVAASQWTNEGPVPRVELAQFAPQPVPVPVPLPRLPAPVPFPDNAPQTPGPGGTGPASDKADQRTTRDLLTLYDTLSAANDGTRIAVIAHVYEPDKSDDQRPVMTWVGTQTQDEAEKACPKLPIVQNFVDESAAEIAKEMPGLSPQRYGTAVHYRLKRKIDALKSKDLIAELSIDPHGDNEYVVDSIRTDTFEKAPNETVCIGDLKTGKSTLSPARMLKLVTRAKLFHKTARRILIFELRPRR